MLTLESSNPTTGGSEESRAKTQNENLEIAFVQMVVVLLNEETKKPFEESTQTVEGSEANSSRPKSGV